MRKFKKELTTEDKLVNYIITLAHSGLSSLDPKLLKDIKLLCKNSSSLIQLAFNTIMKQLKIDHSEVRLISLQLSVELFKRSHDFRVLVIKNLEEIMELTAGIEPTKKLPLPKESAEKMKELALLTVLRWKDEFGKSYKLLVNGYDYLVNVKRVDFETMRQRVEEREQRDREKQRREEEIKQQVLMELARDVQENAAEIETTIQTINNCVSLLLPTPDDFFVTSCEDGCNDDIKPVTPVDSDLQQCGSSDDDENFNDNEPNLRLFGITQSYNLVINIDHKKKINVERNEGNNAVIDNLKENVKLAKLRLFPLLKKWQIGVGNLCLKHDHELVIRVEEMKKRLEVCVEKSKGLRIDGGDESSDEESDMEEVVKDGYEPAVLPVLSDPHPFYDSNVSIPGPSGVVRNFISSDPSKKQSLEKKDTCDVALPEREMKCEIASGEAVEELSGSQESDKSRKERLLAIAPKLPYDVDLYHWEDHKLTTPTVVSVKVNKWGSGDMEVDEIEMPEGVASLRTRVMEFTGRFEPVTRACKAPLPSGALCSRMDRYKCPFHGVIVPRNDDGKCLNADDEHSLPSTSRDSKPPVPDWQDPLLLAQLKATTGIDLKMPERGKKTKRVKGNAKKGLPGADVLDDIKKRNFPGLTDLARSKNNPKIRLKKKLFNRSALKRVADVVNKLERARHKDKFGDQFNYH